MERIKMELDERNFLSATEFRKKMIEDYSNILIEPYIIVKPWKLTRARIGIRKFISLIEETYNIRTIWTYDYDKDYYVVECLK